MSGPGRGGDSGSAVSVLELRGVSKTYGQAPAAVHALAGIDLSERAGEMVAVMGPSGSGKSTLLTIAGSLEDPSSGEVLVCGMAVPKARAAGLAALEALGVADRAGSFPDQLSGGERQRVAIARAVVGNRRLLLADEPSGALDSVNAGEVMRLLHESCQRGVAAVVVTHDAQLAARAGIPPHPQGDPVSTALEGLPDLDADAGSGIVTRRAVIRWGWRLLRREWRQQLLVLGLLTVAVAATVWGASVVTNSQIPPGYPTFGTGAARVTLPGTDPHLAADIADIAGRWGPADLIGEQRITAGTGQSVQLRAESRHGHYNAPLLSLVSGTYPAGPGQVALTSQVAAQSGARVGGTWQAGGTTWQVTGIAQDPSNLADQFALAAPGQLRHPGQAIMLLGPAVRQFGNANEAQVLTATYNPSLADFTDAATALGIVIVLSVLAMSVGLIRSETAPDLRTLTATGASGLTRRTITAATGAALGLLGAILGTAGAVIAAMAWTHSGPTATAGAVPPSDLLILLIGLPLTAAIGGWLFAGREPPAVARQPLE
jgi:ABC-type lipoprotein export system ATPase subunit